MHSTSNILEQFAGRGGRSGVESTRSVRNSQSCWHSDIASEQSSSHRDTASSSELFVAAVLLHLVYTWWQ